MTFSKRYRATSSGDRRRWPFRVQVRPYSFSRPKIRRFILVAAGISLWTHAAERAARSPRNERRHFRKPMVGHDSQPLPPWDKSADVHSSLLRSLSAGLGRFVRWCPGSRAVRLQRLQDHPAECGPLARGAEPRSTMQITGDTSYAVSSRARFAMKLLIHDVFLPRSLRRAPVPPWREVQRG